jgi:hypothetical protein
MDPRQELEVLNWDLRSLDAELVVQFPLGSTLDPLDGLRQFDATLAWNAEGMRAAGIGPHVGEGDLLCGSLL